MCEEFHSTGVAGSMYPKGVIYIFFHQLDISIYFVKLPAELPLSDSRVGKFGNANPDVVNEVFHHEIFCISFYPGAITLQWLVVDNPVTKIDTLWDATSLSCKNMVPYNALMLFMLLYSQ